MWRPAVVNVRVVYFTSRPPPPMHGAFLEDVADALDLADRDGDDAAGDKIRHELQFLAVQVPSWSAARVVGYLETRQVWRSSAGLSVMRTIGEPVIAFTGFVVDSRQEVTIVLLAACYRYPAGGEFAWWRQVVEPRVQAL